MFIHPRFVILPQFLILEGFLEFRILIFHPRKTLAMFRVLSLTFCLFFILNCSLIAQDRMLPTDSVVITHHQTIIKGQNIKYTATCGTQPVWDKDGKTIAALFYTYYTRDGIKDRSNRPLLISFNGGPGSASVWMHVAYTGPMILNVDDEGFPLQPYGVKQNPYSVCY